MWKEGWPRKEGWYDCLLDDELEMKLKFYICKVACKPHWVDSHGEYMESQAHIKYKVDEG